MKRFIQSLSLLIATVGLISAETVQQSVFELRLVQETAGADTEAMSITHRTTQGTSTEKEVFNVQETAMLDSSSIASAVAQTNLRTDSPQIEITFTESGRKRFAEVTRENIGKQLAIVVDGNLLSTPTIMDEISDGKALLAGQFTEEEARSIAARINTAIQSEPEE